MPLPPRGQRAYGLLSCFLLLLVPGLLAGCSGGGDALSFPTEYQAVFLDNGQVFFGRMGNTGSGFISLRDVFFVQRQMEQDQKTARNLLMPLGSEWHGPDFMRINKRHILRIEPVAPDSQVARLIREAKAAPAQATPPAAITPAPTAAPHKGEKKAAPAHR